MVLSQARETVSQVHWRRAAAWLLGDGAEQTSGADRPAAALEMLVASALVTAIRSSRRPASSRTPWGSAGWMRTAARAPGP